ncbi:HD domain-containing protein [Streptomyces sp. HB2AG]|uniref:HD domain-containing protein n=1 Tax=Streptomyces sp. HB2AG TaxID=2983400 RepID=UPI003FA6A3E4
MVPMAATTHPAHEALLTRWNGLLRAVRDEAQEPDLPDPAPYGLELLRRWAEPQRRYHTTDHLLAVLDRIDLLAGYADDVQNVRLAAWFHDAVYLPDRSTNEERSARLAERALPEAGVDAARAAEVARLVLLTRDHDPAEDDRDGEVLCDADLAVLASPPQEYAAYAAAVREEYGFVPDDAFRAGRARVLRSLLGMPRLFRTPEAQDRWEDVARRNAATELELLEAAGADTGADTDAGAGAGADTESR